MIYSIADLVDDKNNMKEIIDGIKTGKFNVIKFENINNTPTEFMSKKYINFECN